MWTVKYQGAALQIKQIRDGDMKMAYDMALVFWMRCEWDDLVRKEWQIKKEWGRIEDRGKPKEMMDRGTILYRCYLCQVVALYGIKHKSNTMKQRLMGIYLFCRYLIINVLTKKCGDHPDNCNSSSSLFIKRLFFKRICSHPHPQVQFSCCMHKRVALTWTRQVKLHENFHVNKSREEERKCVCDSVWLKFFLAFLTLTLKDNLTQETRFDSMLYCTEQSGLSINWAYLIPLWISWD